MSPSGAGSFQKHADVITARRSSGGEYQRIDYFGLQDGQSAQVRFLEQGQDLTWAISHRIKVPGLSFPQDVLCLDQEDEGTSCPACQSDAKEVKSRSTKGYLNVIWRGNEDEGITRAPVYKRNDKGSPEKNPRGEKIVTGFEDAVFLWKCSKTVFEQILEKDKRYRGIMSRDFIVVRKGAGLENTTYFIEPAVVDGGPEPMTIADQNLAKDKFDIVTLTTPGSYGEMINLLSGQPLNNQEKFSRETTQENVFNSGNPMRSSAFQR